jgi:hypothetical protein
VRHSIYADYHRRTEVPSLPILALVFSGKRATKSLSLVSRAVATQGSSTPLPRSREKKLSTSP